MCLENERGCVRSGSTSNVHVYDDDGAAAADLLSFHSSSSSTLFTDCQKLLRKTPRNWTTTEETSIPDPIRRCESCCHRDIQFRSEEESIVNAVGSQIKLPVSRRRYRNWFHTGLQETTTCFVYARKIRHIAGKNWHEQLCDGKQKKRERIITCVDRRRSVIFLLDKGTSELENQEERRERDRGPPARRRACEEAPPKECAFSLPAAATPHIMMPKTS